MNTDDAYGVGGMIHLAIAFDDNYLDPFYALASSLVSVHPHGRLHIHAIATGISDNQKEEIRRYLSAGGHALSFYDIDESVARRFVLLDKWTSAVYYRLFFPFVIPASVQRLLYLDSDMIVLKNLSDLYTQDLETYPVAAVYDNYVKIQPKLGIDEPGEYFNSGMLLIDIQRWQAERISEQAMDYLIRYPERIQFVDQCALNAVLYKRWKKIDKRYNLLYSYIPEGMRGRALQHALKDVVVVHFTIQRPWHMLCRNPFRTQYFRFLRGAGRGKSFIPYDDFSILKFPAWLKIRVTDLYFTLPLLPRLWRRLKSGVS